MNDDNVECLICHKKFRFVNNTHLKTHKYSIEEYLREFPNAILKSESYKYETGSSLRGKTYEEVYGFEKSNNLKKIRKEKAHKQFEDPDQRKIRSENKWTDERRQKMSRTLKLTLSSSEQRERLRIQTTKLIESGKITVGRQSKIALNWIVNYLIENNISDERCYYFGGGINENEYYQQIFNPLTNKFECGSFDLTILNEFGQIDTIFELHGPWHWKLKEVKVDPHSPCCPLKTNKYTKLESYNKDILKINHAIKIASNVFVYWIYTNELIEIKHEIKLLKI